MSASRDHITTLVSLTGSSLRDLRFLANLSPDVSEPESIWSVVYELDYESTVVGKKAGEFEEWLTSMDESASGNLYAVSMEGLLHIRKGTTWSVIDLDCPNGMNQVWAASDDEIFAVGVVGDRVRVRGGQVSVERDPAGRRLNGVHGASPRSVFAVGDGGLVVRFDGTAWTELAPPTNHNLLTVYCRGNGETYIAGAHGMLFRSTAKGWERIASPNIDITSLAWFQDTLYAAAGGEGVFALGPRGLERIKEVRLYRLRTVAELLLGIGNRFIAQFDGTGWQGGEIDL